MAIITISIDPQLSRYTHGDMECVVEGTTVAEALLAFFNRYPSVYVFAATQKDAAGFIMVLNDEAVIGADELSKPLQDNDTVELLVVPTGEAGAVGAGILNLVGSGFTATMISSQIIGSLVLIGVSIALNVLMGALMGDLEMPGIQSGSVDNSASVTFDGVKNTTAAGTPIQLIYGMHRTGGQILSLFTEPADTDTAAAETSTVIHTDTMLFYQIGISEGVISSISDVEVNKLPSAFYSAVTTVPTPGYFTLGESTQDIMTGFNKLFTTTTIGRKVINASQSIPQVNPTGGEFKPAYGYVDVPYGAWGERPNISVKHGLYQPVSYLIPETQG